MNATVDTAQQKTFGAEGCAQSRCALQDGFIRYRTEAEDKGTGGRTDFYDTMVGDVKPAEEASFHSDTDGEEPPTDNLRPY